jgi:hypothetical protein
MLRRKPIVSIGAFALAVAAVACTVRYATDALDTPMAADAAVDVAAVQDAGTDAGPGCELAKPPARPAKDGDDAGPDRDLIFAFEDIWMIPRGTEGPAGFDLDNTCTCPEKESCNPVRFPDASFQSSESRCDGDGGRDNGILPGYLATRSVTKAYTEEYWGETIRVGRQTSLLELSNYNGSENDTSVSVAMVASGAMVPRPDGGSAPTFDGNDTWSIRVTELDQGAALLDAGPCPSLLGQCVPKSIDRNAYVRDGVLVAAVDGTLAWPIGNLAQQLDMKRGVLVAKLQKLPSGKYALGQGQINGRLKGEELLRFFGAVTVPPLTTPICNSEYFQTMRAGVCESQDVAENAEDDGKGVTCGASTILIFFSAKEAKLGPVVPSSYKAVSCPPNWAPSCDPKK